MCNRIPALKLIVLASLLSLNGLGQSSDNQDRNDLTRALSSEAVVVAAVRPPLATEPIQKPVTGRPDGADLPLGPTQIYKIGVGDVVLVDIKNTTNAAAYYPVLDDGTIDIPLSAKPVRVAGQTTEQAAKAIAGSITLYTNTLVEVRVREYRSHRIKVSGLVEWAGAHSIKREAVPLYVIRAEVGVDRRATNVVVRRSNSGLVARLDLRASDAENLLIYPGDSVEFTADSKTPGLVDAAFYQIAGAVQSVGQMEYTYGMTLSQAIKASGGVKGAPKQASLRRKSEDGKVSLAKYNLRLIKEGRIFDPLLLPGDMIEIGN